jgi:hypothetical protein
VCSGVAFQPAHYIVSLQNLTAVSMSFSVLRETFKVNLSFIRRLKSPQFYSSWMANVWVLPSVGVLSYFFPLF